MIRQHFRGRLAGIRNAEREQKSRQIPGSCWLRSLAANCCAFLSPNRSRPDQILERQIIQIGRVANAQLVVELLSGHDAERFDVHRIAGSEMGQAGDHLRHAVEPVLAEQVRAAPHQLRCRRPGNASGTMISSPSCSSVTLPKISGITSLERRINTFVPRACFSHFRSISPTLFSVHLLHRHTADLNRLHVSNRRNFAGTSHFPYHIAQHGRRFFSASNL